MQHGEQLTMTEARPRIETKANEATVGAIKSILFYVHDDDELETRLQAGLSLARACSAHLQLLQVIPISAYGAADIYGGAYVSGEIVEVLQEQADKLQARVEAHLGKEDVSWSYDSVTSLIVPELLQNASLSDLVFMGREPRWHEFSRTGPGLIGELVCHMHTPLCIPGEKRKTFDPFGKAVVAWNGSFEAANAIRSTIGLLKMASDVRVIRYTEEKAKGFPDTRVLEYLSRHGIHAQIEMHCPRTEIATDLVDYADRLGAEYIVMGGYGHSRAGEFLFGGVTRDLLRACAISLVMAH